MLSACESNGTILAAEYIPSPGPLRFKLMLPGPRTPLPRESGFGSPRFLIFLPGIGEGSLRFPRFPIQMAGKQGIPDSRFGRERESGSRFGGPGVSSELSWPGPLWSGSNFHRLILLCHSSLSESSVESSIAAGTALPSPHSL